MPVRWGWGAVILLAVLLGTAGHTHAQGSVVGRVTYVAAGTVYVGAGRNAGIAVGDTLLILHSGSRPLTVVVNAISSSSSAAPFAATAPTVGDSVVALTLHPVPSAQRQQAQSPPVGTGAPTARAQEPTIRGRVALQYAGAGDFGRGLDYSMPSILLRLDAASLGSEHLGLSFYGRTSRDFSPAGPAASTVPRTRTRIYDLTLSYHDGVQVDVGRIFPRHASALGQLDGIQVSTRAGRWTAGILAGMQPDYQTSGVDTKEQKAAVFVAYQWGGEGTYGNDVALAYGRQLHRGDLDRDFLVLQGSIFTSDVFSLYQTSEVDLHTLHDGKGVSSFSLTNTFLTATYRPIDWASVSLGYDATRPLYLLETMKSIADSLLDRELRQGFRGSLSARLPGRWTATVQGTLRLKTETSRQSRSFGGSLRVAELLGTPLGIGAGYTKVVGAYTDGWNAHADLDYWFGSGLTCTLRADRFAYTIVGTSATTVSTTVSGMTSARFGDRWFGLLSVDQVWEQGRSSQRILAEIGLQFGW